MDSDHFLVIRMENNNCQNKYKQTIDYEIMRTYKLKEKSVASIFQIKTEERFSKILEIITILSLDDLWEVYKTIILETAKEMFGIYRTNKNKKQTSWWTNEIKPKKKKWKQYLNNNTISN